MPDRPSPSLDPAELLAQRAWMRRFAAALAGAEGEDLVQDAWVRVLSARDPALARPRAWLASVLRNAARMRRRGAVRREQREARAAREEALASTDELAAQAELEQLAVRAVLALPAPYRQALLLRYVGGLEPSEIARQLELPPATVRCHIARGLAEVRAELDRRHGRREAWLALLAPRAVLGKGTATMVVGGGIWMSTKWMAAAALAAAALLWVGRTNRGHTLHAPRSSAASGGELAAPAPLAPEPMAEPSRIAVATERRAVLPPSVLLMTDTELLVHVTRARDGSPAADVPLRVESLDVEPYRPVTPGTTDASGTARFAALPPGEQWVDTLREACGHVQLVPGETATLELAIPPGVDVECRVVDRDGVGVAGAEVWLSDIGSDSSGIVVGETDAGGRLFLRDVPGQHCALAARAPARAPSVQRGFRGNPGTRLEIELVLPGPGASLAGLVQNARGEPLAGIEVLVGAEFPPSVRSWDGEIATDAPSQLAISDAGEGFLVHGLAPGPLEVQARASGYGTGHASVELAAGETGRCTVVLEAEARVAGVVRDEDGRPLARVHVTGGALSPEGEGDFDFSGCETFTAADGSYVLRGLEAGPCHLGASSETNLNGGAQTELELRPGEEARWDVVLVHGGSLGGVVLDERGAPLARWLVTAIEPERPEPEYWLRSTYSDAAGRFRMENCPAQRFVLALRAPEERSGDPALVLEDFRVGDEALVLRVMDAWRPSAFVEGRLVAADGAPLVEAQVIFEATANDFPYLPDAAGRFRIGPLRAGEYWLHADAQGRGEVRTPRFALAFGETKDVGELVLDRCGLIRVRAVAKGGGALPAGTALDEVALLRDDESWGSISFEDLQGRSEPLGAGTYIVHARERSWCAADVEVEVRPGATAELELAFEPATERLIEVVFPDGVPASVLELRVLDAHGRAFDGIDDDVREGRYCACVGGLLVGSYSVEARAADGRSATGELRVLDLAEDDTLLVLTLR